MEKRRKSSLESGALIFVAAGILIAVNALSALGVYARKDVTKSEKFTLSKGSGHLLQSMKQQLTVECYVSKGLPKLDAFVRDLRDLMQEYKNAGGGKFDYTLIEAKDEEQRKKLSQAAQGVATMRATAAAAPSAPAPKLREDVLEMNAAGMKAAGY